MISIRPAVAADLEGMLAIARRLPAWFNDDGIAEMTQDFQTHGGLVADDDGTVAGFITFGPSPHTPEPGLLEITWLGVDPGRRRSGLGRQLVAALVERCRTQETHTLQVSTIADSVDYPPYAETRAFYRAVGFADYRVDRDFYGPGDDRLLLRRAVFTPA